MASNAEESCDKIETNPLPKNSKKSFFNRQHFSKSGKSGEKNESTNVDDEEDHARPERWSMGVLNDPHTHEVPGSVLLLTSNRVEPLGIRTSMSHTSHTSLPSATGTKPRQASLQSRGYEGKKLTVDGKMILEPQPDDSLNDPLNWPSWKRDAALLSLGLYCMVGGGMTPILAAGFTDVAKTFNVTTVKVALTTGLYMMGMGVGSVFASPTAILFGKRPTYLVGAIFFIVTSVWCAASPSYISLLVGRIIQGMSISPVECLPSATIAEIFFLHERAFRIGIYTLLLLGGKNLVPLVSAAIINSLGWRWVFWIVAMIVGFCWVLLFLFVPETFWERVPHARSRKGSKRSSVSGFTVFRKKVSTLPSKGVASQVDGGVSPATPEESTSRKMSKHVGFAGSPTSSRAAESSKAEQPTWPTPPAPHEASLATIASGIDQQPPIGHGSNPSSPTPLSPLRLHLLQDQASPNGGAPPTPSLHNINSPFYVDIERKNSNYFNKDKNGEESSDENSGDACPVQSLTPLKRYTSGLREKPTLTFIQQMKPYNGRLHHDNWFRVAVRPFILYTYPAVLWSSLVYACSVGWLIVLSESVAVVYRARTAYGFSALSTGLIYISPFIGGILGTAVAGKVSDIVVQMMAKRNGGLYEPEFRLLMALPVTIATVIGLMGFGWSAEVHDPWIAPTVFFGVISFGCSLGSTTAITFVVDSYRQYAGEALVTLNFSKNIFHGLVFSLFFPSWLEHKGSKSVFIWLGVIQLVLMTSTIPMYIFGKRARMWTVRRNMMERF